MDKPFVLWVRKHWAKILSASVVCVVLLGNKGFRRLVAHTFALRSANSELTALKQEEAELQVEVKAAAQDDGVLERAARKELGYLRPGEIEYRFPPPK